MPTSAVTGSSFRLWTIATSWLLDIASQDDYKSPTDVFRDVYSYFLGVITTLRTLDRESEQYYWITVLARDRASVPLSGHMFVLVEVTDVNDNAPRPTRPIYFARYNLPVCSNIDFFPYGNF